ncbi:TonB-dependent receptor [Parapedobacter sp. SGR-10]|uniref:TonB-dependent receptor n=1 Tax=Parapedobacter sp. SGR-10 TaxID=2710879 RepID=UPI0013D0ABAD|nr:TonB-dependent receptor plug domain-containing protein [Parapedobacter sp. SGR-10]NGF57515.1 TonB-dependent receptor [Parapedobacter sp. SGR-10]
MDKALVIVISLLLSASFLFAQHKEVTINGVVKDAQGQLIPGATVYLNGTSWSTISDNNGKYALKVPNKQYEIHCNAEGYPLFKKNINLANANMVLDIHLEATRINSIEETVVVGRSTLKEIKESAYTVTALDAKAFHNTTADISTLINKASGARMRESGGLGSRTNINLNGFTEKQVKFFIDGVPAEIYGSTFRANIIPVNFAERIEIYKGVVPVSLGGDALGGAINIVSDYSKKNFLDVSYSYGSFNTHTSFVNAGMTTAKGFTFNVNAFQNYSDNNYWVDVPIKNLSTGEVPSETTRVRRFHDNYHNETVIIKTGVVNKSYADVLLVGINLGSERAEDQHGNDMKTVFGQRHRKATTLTPFLTYNKKNVLIDGLDIRLAANYNLGYAQFIDTAKVAYNWLGDSVRTLVPGEFNYSSAKYYDNNALVLFSADYAIHPQHAITLSNTASVFNREGKDPFDYSTESHMLEATKTSTKNALGLAYKYRHGEDLNITLFGKHYYQKSEGPYNTSNGSNLRQYEMHSTEFNYFGYGGAATWFLNRFQFKGSAERTYRLPETEEIFGNESFNAGNILLKPEKSLNFNLTTVYDASINIANQLEIGTSLLSRKTEDFIVRMLSSSNGTPATYSNQGLVHNKGIEFETKYFYKNKLNAGFNLTYMDQIFKDMYEEGMSGENISKKYNSRVPNIPYFFTAANIGYSFHSIFSSEDRITINYSNTYVHSFLREIYSNRNTGKVPTQFSHNTDIGYTFLQNRMHFTLECWNLTNEDLYDNFSLQKPGRSFRAKIRYNISK